jgi:hypothetical protein
MADLFAIYVEAVALLAARAVVWCAWIAARKVLP